MINAVIIDDSQLAREDLCNQLEERYSDVINVAGSVSNASEGLVLIRRIKPQLIFLDVEMPDISGIELLHKVLAPFCHRCKVIIYTAHQKYMIDTLRSPAFDFLQKPINENELDIVIGRVLNNDLSSDVSEFAHTEDAFSEMLSPETHFTSIGLYDVCLFEYDTVRKYWFAVSEEGREPVKLRRGITAEDLLGLGKRFVQVSRSHIINIDCLQEVHKGVCIFFPPFNHIKNVKVSRQYRKNL